MIPEERPMKTRGMGWRISTTILLGVGWLVFIIIWLFFYASGFSIYQNLAILVVSLLIVAGGTAVLWVGLGIRMGKTQAPGAPEWSRFEREKWRGWLSAIIWVAWVVFIVVWLFFYADSFSGYQNLAILIVSLLIAGGVTAVVWGGWWKYIP